MAKPEHLEILKQGVEAWNRWRREHQEVTPDLTWAPLYRTDLTRVRLDRADLTQARLERANLTSAYLMKARLTAADLTAADLRGADLNFADLTSARLSGANLTRAQLNYADLIRADLTNADLTGADLTSAYLIDAHLGGANFSDVRLGYTTFVGNDLSRIEGLDTVYHHARSGIGIDTIYYSRGKVPEIFLRGCGVPESFIVQMRALVASTEAIQFYSCFISYSSKDQKFAERLHADLQGKGVRCWYAPEDLKIGDRFRDRIDESIRLHDKLLIVLSENSVSSPWVNDEVETAIEREHRERRTVLFPIKIDEAVMGSEQAWAAAIRRTRHVGDFTSWKDHDSYQKAFERLLRDLKAEEKKS